MIDKIFYLIFFGILLAFFRLIPHPPNFTPIIASAIMAPLLIKDRMAGIAIPIFAMFISDIVIGFHPYQFVIYSTLISIGLFAPMTKKHISILLVPFIASLWFFITTNFAVWILWDFYPKTFEGLIMCYTLAIPFLKNTLLSTILYTGILKISFNYIEIIKNKSNYFIYNLINNKFNL